MVANCANKPNLRFTAALACLALVALLAAVLAGGPGASTAAARSAAPAIAKRIATRTTDCDKVLRLARRPQFKRLLKVKAVRCRSAETHAKVGPGQALGGGESTEKPIPTPVDPTSLYWGAWIGSQRTGTEAPWDMNAVSSFESAVDKPLSLVQFAAPFADCSASPCSYYTFPRTPMENIRQHGSIPFFSWSSQSTPSSVNEPEFQLADVIDGSQDSYIRQFAEEAKAWGHPFYLRFNWEMNGNWFPWSESVNGNQPGEYVVAWRHVHDIFTAVGATNATWTWCPNVDPHHQFQNLAALYPGDEYVDWTCMDGYNWGGSNWESFKDLYGPTYHEITDQIAPSKPMIIGEVGSNEAGGSKSQWIADMLQELPTEFQKIRGVMWFDKYQEGDWPIESSPASQSAFATGIQSPSYLGNQYASLPSGTVPVPG